ncbi:hypothetical protein BH10ACI1_BH10ACI1_03930 [soil metagenome]
MPHLKLLVSLFFILFALTFFGQRWFATSSVAKNIAAILTLSTPNGVTASDGDYSDKVGLMWFTVRDANLYRIFRNTSNDSSSATAVGTTAANYFFDTTAVANQNYFYWVRAENGGVNSSLSSSAQGLRSIGAFSSEIFSPLDPPPVPNGNAVTAAKAYLGKTLFWDEQLSSTLTVSCGTCHRAGNGGSDPRTNATNSGSRNPGFDNLFNTADDVFGSPGVPLNNQDGTYSPSSLFGFNEQVTSRKTPSYLNAGRGFNGLFWDGRASNIFRDPLTNEVLLTEWGSLESQIIGPPTSDVEMAHGNRNWTQVAEQIQNAKPLALASDIPASLSTWIDGRTYPQLFEEVFGTSEVTPARIAMAIATHERTLFTDRTPLDRYASNIEQLTASEDRGRAIFVQSNCNFCHGGPLLADQNFHYIGVRPQAEDLGRAIVTGSTNDRGRFRTPTLRNVALRAPYMHNGQLATLEDVVEFYNRGGDFTAANKDPRVRPLNLTVTQRADLVAFLKRPLTDLRVSAELPPFDRPHLYTESNRVPVISGIGRAGSGNITPQVKAIEPPLAGNPSFTVGVSGALGGANAVLVIDSNDPNIGTSIPANGSFARVSVNVSSNGFASVSLPIPSNLIGQTFYGRWYITDSGAANGFSVSQVFRFTVFGDSSNAINKAPFDFDGDSKTDLSIFRPASGEWWYQRSSNGGNYAAQFGISTDKLAPADFTGDGKTDIAFFRPSTGEWFILRSDDGSFYSFPFGLNGDIPAVGDFDADNKADNAVFRPSNSTWYIRRSIDGAVIIQQFGQTGDVPVVADYDGDGRSDIAIYRPSLGQWWINRSTDGLIAFQFGNNADKPVQGDFTGDAKTDAAIFRPSSGEWFVLRSENFSFYSFPFGAIGDIPAPGDYDGDGKTDAAVFRPSNSNWFVNKSSGGILIQAFGQNGDTPIPSAFISP